MNLDHLVSSVCNGTITMPAAIVLSVGIVAVCVVCVSLIRGIFH